MVKLILRIVLCFSLCFCTTVTFAQENVVADIAGPKQQLATILFAGLAGAILGLSTLSFYGRPQDKLSNIAIGFAIGVISGTVYTTYQTATQPYSGLEGMNILDQERDWELMQMAEYDLEKSSEFKLNYSWSF